MKKGFTLAELLIALAILGVLTVFTIPKVLNTNQDQEKKAIFREIIGAFSTLTYTGWQSQEINRNTGTYNYHDYYYSRLNAVKICPTNSAVQGCWDVAIQGDPWNASNPAAREGAILHNGATIVGFRNYGNPYGSVMIDWNGTAPPNAKGEDQLLLLLCVSPDGAKCFGIRAGDIKPVGWETESIALYREIFN